VDPDRPSLLDEIEAEKLAVAPSCSYHAPRHRSDCIDCAEAGSDPTPEQMPEGDDRDAPMTLAEGRAARDEAMNEVDAGAAILWKQDAMDALRKVAISQADLIAEDIWKFVSKPREPRATGPLMMKAARLGYIEQTEDFRQCPSRHATYVRVWRSLIYAGST
jgi:hypothetical protein